MVVAEAVVVVVAFTDADRDQEVRGLAMNIHRKMKDVLRKLATALKASVEKDQLEV